MEGRELPLQLSCRHAGGAGHGYWVRPWSSASSGLGPSRNPRRLGSEDPTWASPTQALCWGPTPLLPSQAAVRTRSPGLRGRKRSHNLFSFGNKTVTVEAKPNHTLPPGPRASGPGGREAVAITDSVEERRWGGCTAPPPHRARSITRSPTAPLSSASDERSRGRASPRNHGAPQPTPHPVRSGSVRICPLASQRWPQWLRWGSVGAEGE